MSDLQYPGGMYVDESGTPGSPAIVFIHGAGQSGREWREHMRRLSDFHCLAPDLPGFGRSNQLPSASFSQTSDLIARLIEQRVPARRASVVGISSGGMIIHALLRRHPDRVERAIIDGTPVRARTRRLVALTGIPLAPFIHTRPVLALNRDTHDPADLRVASRRAFGRSIAECFRTSASIDAPCPTLLIAGEREAGLQGGDTRETNAALATLMPHAEAWYAPGLFHCWQRVAPDLHIRTVGAWVSGQDLPTELHREPTPSPEAVARVRAIASPRAEMHVEESGTPGSPAIVFIHGAGQSGREWREHMRRLSDFHCLAPDLPGFGRSNQLPSASKERIADLIAELIETRVPAKRASVVGISSAGLQIHALLERHPERVERAIIDGSPPYDAPRIGRALMRLFMVGLVPIIHTRPGLAFFRDTHDPEDLRVASHLAFGRALADCLGMYATFDAPCPTLLVAGEKETRVRPTNAALAELMPHAEAWYVPGLDHCWQRTELDLHIRMVEAWVGGQELPSELRREAAPSPAKVEQVRRTGSEFWYVRHKGRLMRLVRFYFRPFRKPLAEAYGKAAGEAIARDALGRFEVLLPDIPYIGGGSNSMTVTLVKIAAKLAMYQALRTRGASEEEAARLVHLGEVAFYKSAPMRWVMRLQGRGFLSRRGVDMWKRIAATSQERRYPGDWVYEVVEADGSDSGMGLDCIECGAVKYLDREGAPELTPYLCWIDYPQFAAMRLRLDRTETIAQGGQRCDFRVSRGKPTRVEPEFLHA